MRDPKPCGSIASIGEMIAAPFFTLHSLTWHEGARHSLEHLSTRASHSVT